MTRDTYGIACGPGRGLDFVRRLPQYRIQGRYNALALRHLEYLQRSLHYDLSWQTFPSNSQLPVAAGATVENQASTAAGSFLVAFSGRSGIVQTDERAPVTDKGFRFEVVDAGSERTLFEFTADYRCLAGNAANGPFLQPSPFLLPHGGLAIPKSGLFIVRVTNLNVDNTNNIQVWLEFGTPIGGIHRV